MAREIILYPEKATKAELKGFVEKRGYKKAKHFWDWLEGTLNYFWFNDKDYKSISGVELDIYPVDNTENKYTENQWAVHVRNTYSGSIFDVTEFNDVVKQLKKQFGGTIIGDYGKNRYAPLWEDNSTPMQRGIERIYKYQKDVLDKIKFSLPEEKIKLPKIENNKDKVFQNYIKQHDPSRVIYNGLIPLLIATIENLLYSYFAILLKYDNSVNKKLTEKYTKIKLYFCDIEKLEKGSYKKENVIANQYNFQNLQSAKSAYDLFEIDLHKIFHNKILRNSRPRIDLFQALSELIENRHKIIHNLTFDFSVSKNDFINKLNVVQNMIDTITTEIENKYKIQIDKEL